MNNVDLQLSPNGIGRAHMLELYQTFRPKEIKPPITKDQIMYEAGQQSIIHYIERRFFDGQISAATFDL
jgi:hypothetical protein